MNLEESRAKTSLNITLQSGKPGDGADRESGVTDWIFQNFIQKTTRSPMMQSVESQNPKFHPINSNNSVTPGSMAHGDEEAGERINRKSALASLSRKA
jgi:hypothetical protein